MLLLLVGLHGRRPLAVALMRHLLPWLLRCALLLLLLLWPTCLLGLLGLIAAAGAMPAACCLLLGLLHLLKDGLDFIIVLVRKEEETDSMQVRGGCAWGFKGVAGGPCKARQTQRQLECVCVLSLSSLTKSSSSSAIEGPHDNSMCDVRAVLSLLLLKRDWDPALNTLINKAHCTHHNG